MDETPIELIVASLRKGGKTLCPKKKKNEKMKLVWSIIFSTVLLSVSADCGCLKCGKHLKIISPPNAPVTIIERGEGASCEKPIPYRIEIPQIVCQSCHPRRSYGYKVHSVNYAEHKLDDPVLCQHGYKVEVPYVPQGPACRYCQGLVAKTDRMVIPARDECPPPPPSCCGPTIEYLRPRYDCDSCVCCQSRRKRDLYGRNRNEARSEIDWAKILEPKPIRSLTAKNPWEIDTTTRKSPLEQLTMDLRERIENKHKQDGGRNRHIQREPLEDEPFRINIPLNPKKQFFRRAKPTFKPPPPPPLPASQKIHQKRLEIDPSPDRNVKPIGSKLFTKLVEKSGKFADVENVKIVLPPNRREKEKALRPVKARRARSITLEDQAFPYYKISRTPGKGREQLRKGPSENSVRDLRRKYLKPLDVEAIAPENQAYYLMNTPIRMLNQINKMREHVGPMVQSIPNVLDTSANYFLDLGKRFRRGAMDFFKDFFRNVKGFPSKMVMSFATPPKRSKRNMYEAIKSRMMDVDDVEEPRFENRAAIVKLVPDDEVHEFLKEKLSIFASSEEDDQDESEEDMLMPVLPKASRKAPRKKNRGKNGLRLEKLSPKVVLENGRSYLDIDGSKRLLREGPRRRKPPPSTDNDDIQDMIEGVIEEARLKASNPRGHDREYESEMFAQTVRSNIGDTLDDIQDLIEQDFDRHEEIYENLLELQRLKESAVEEWKYALIRKKHDDYNAKINLLNKFNRMLSLKDDVVKAIGEVLLEDCFNTEALVKKLVRLQKLQCLLVKIVEDFAETVRYQTRSEVGEEIKQVEFLQKLDLISGKSMSELSSGLRKERDREVEEKLRVLDRLKGLLDCDKTDVIDRVGKLLWEIANSRKLQKDTVSEMNDKIGNGSRIRKELKIIFDLEKQIEICRKSLDDVFRDVPKLKDNAKVKMPLKMKTPPKRKPLDLLNRRKHK